MKEIYYDKHNKIPCRRNTRNLHRNSRLCRTASPSSRWQRWRPPGNGHCPTGRSIAQSDRTSADCCGYTTSTSCGSAASPTGNSAAPSPGSPAAATGRSCTAATAGCNTSSAGTSLAWSTATALSAATASSWWWQTWRRSQTLILENK